jgi:hypothetical protein
MQQRLQKRSGRNSDDLDSPRLAAAASAPCCRGASGPGPVGSEDGRRAVIAQAALMSIAQGAAIKVSEML